MVVVEYVAMQRMMKVMLLVATVGKRWHVVKLVGGFVGPEELVELSGNNRTVTENYVEV